MDPMILRRQVLQITRRKLGDALLKHSIYGAHHKERRQQ